MCFRDPWVSIGTVAMHPRLPTGQSSDTSETKSLTDAFRYGSYEWHVPERDALHEKIRRALLPEEARSEGALRDRTDDQIETAVNAVVRLAVRCGLAAPIVDPMIVSRLPRVDSLLIVMDTSAVLQGGLDFVSRHLGESVRIGVPAIVHMEIINFTDRFLSQRRAEKATASTLRDHVQSQAGQRALLRLEKEHAVERPRLGADPLRGIVRLGADAEDRSLGLQVVQKSFADRLILETAIRKRTEALPGSAVWLMTADGGLARMALAESVKPLFFRTDGIPGFFGATLSGVPFSPWSTSGARTYPVSFATVLWECAVVFGAARLVSSETGAAFEVRSMGERFPWQPYHAREDLLWVRWSPGTTARPPRQVRTGPEPAVGIHTRQPEEPGRVSRPQAHTGTFKFRPSAMLRLLARVAAAPLSDDEAMQTVGANSRRTYAEYYRFLLAGELVSRSGERVQATDALMLLTAALRDSDFDGIRGCLAVVPSFGEFLRTLDERRGLERTESGIRDRAFPAYCAFAEMCCAGIRLESTAIIATPENPVPEMFAEIAIAAYDSVRRGEALVLTGSWLEHLVREFRIHPVRARQRLAEAKQGGLLHRYFEGSTPETRFPDRKVHVLENREGHPTLREVNLYHGDFLHPGQSSASIRLVRTTA